MSYDHRFDKYDSLVTKITIIVLSFIIAVSAVIIAFADDTESELGLCLRGWTARCPEAKLQHDLEGKLMIWNSLNCSVRDICNVLPNVTNGGCDTNDEAFNLTGKCDPDERVCFESKEAADKYKKENPDMIVTFPCGKNVIHGQEELK